LSSSKRERLLEQNVFNIITLSFDDNKVFKCQLERLIFVQVCRAIVKNYKSSIGSEKTKESKGIYKGSLCCKKESEDKERLKTIRS